MKCDHPISRVAMSGVDDLEIHQTELHELKPVTFKEVDSLIKKKCSNTSCLLNKIPMWLLKPLHSNHH